MTRSLLAAMKQMIDVKAYEEPFLAPRYAEPIARLFQLLTQEGGRRDHALTEYGLYRLYAARDGESGLKEALAHLEEALRIQPSPTALFAIADAQYGLGNLERAFELLRDLKREGHRISQHPYYFFLQFQCAVQMGRMDLAQLAMENWGGEEKPLAGRRLVVTTSSGPGDVLRTLAGLFPQLEAAESLRVVCQPRLWPFVRAVLPQAQFLESTDLKDPSENLVSIPYALDFCLNHVGKRIPPFAARLWKAPEIQEAAERIRAAFPELREGACAFHWRTNMMNARRMSRCLHPTELRGFLADDRFPKICFQHGLSPHERKYLEQHGKNVVIAEDRLSVYENLFNLYALVAQCSATLGPGLTGTEFASISGAPVFAVDVDGRWRNRNGYGYEGRDVYFPNTYRYGRPYGVGGAESVKRATRKIAEIVAKERAQPGEPLAPAP
ncbi:tetratricopeptide repeat protein [Neomegalonema perideroedes]|uniref:tetratricopeptide repeat protein n=1 Tax=Neomegalonema perideroedes TaxID=217219 RepID=UPI0012FD2F8D|nr:hypothetical protein [Neomegalonema perideroedes]